jgi:hypothetical protein
MSIVMALSAGSVIVDDEPVSGIVPADLGCTGLWQPPESWPPNGGKRALGEHEAARRVPVEGGVNI